MVMFGFISRRVERYKQKTLDGAQIVWDNFFKGGMFALFSATIIWISVFMYIAFYYYYMPSVYHQRPVHLQFKTCESEGTGMCSYPVAHIQLTKYQQLLMVGQTYRIYLKLEMPESQANKDLGMFMVCAQLADKNGITVSHSCRSAILHYRSALLSMLTTVTFYPLMMFGNAEEKQVLTLELYSNYEEDQNHPVTDVYIELQTRRVEYYSASIHIQAHLKGLRYLMFHWPIISAVVGISSNLFFIVFLVSISWWHVQVRAVREESDLYDLDEVSEDEVEKEVSDGSQQHSEDSDRSPEDSGLRSRRSFLGARQMIETFIKPRRPNEDIPQT